MFLTQLALGLIAFGGGLFLLAKGNSENRSGLFKFCSWFIIVVSLLIIICVGTRSVMQFTHHQSCDDREMMCPEMNGPHCMMHGYMHSGSCDMKGAHKGMCGDSAMADTLHGR